jgi:hypothetical protein
MPELAETINYSGSTQTRKLSFNLEKIRKFGEAMTFGAGGHFREHDECNTSLIMMSGCGQSNDLAYWISQDVKNNTKLLKILTTEIAIGGDTEDSDYVFNFGRISEYSKESFNDDITNMLTSIRERLPLSSEESTISLAKRVAAMKDDSMDSDENIERWAHKLANDISKGND